MRSLRDSPFAKKVARDRVVSTVDSASRGSHKSRHSYINGYKGRISVEPATEVVVNTSFTKGNESDTGDGEVLLEVEDQPVVVHGDTGCSGASFRDKLNQHNHQSVIKCHPFSVEVPGDFSISDFEID